MDVQEIDFYLAKEEAVDLDEEEIGVEVPIEIKKEE